MRNLFSILIFMTALACEETQQSSTGHSHQSSSRFLKADQELNQKMGKARSYYDLQLAAEDLGVNIRLRLTAFNRSSHTEHSFEWLRKNSLGEETSRHSEIIRVEPGQSWQTELILAKDDLAPGESLFFFFFHMEQGTRHGATQSWQYNPQSEDAPTLLQKSNADLPRIRE